MAELAHPPPLRGLVLAGGRSERLGRDKAALVVAGETLLDRAVALVARVVGDVRIAVRADQAPEPLRQRHPQVLDVPGIGGPAAGILAAHRLAPDAAWLVLACDMARVDRALLERLVRSRDASRSATAFRNADDGKPEPLCAIYEPATLARFRRELEAGGASSPRGLLAASNPLLLDSPGADALGSINTPDDLVGLPGAAGGGRAGEGSH
jgi:molybdopterin-guanine dinucleotide biosynthesis protein A